LTTKTTRCLIALLVTGLAHGVVLPRQSRADFVAATGDVARSDQAASAAVASDGNGSDDNTAPELGAVACLRAQEMRLAMLFLLIGDVPAIDLSNPAAIMTGTPTGTSPDPLPTGSVPNPGETGTPSTTPEPSAWILGVIGSAVVVAGSRLRFCGR
jgi:hypothetical protein